MRIRYTMLRPDLDVWESVECDSYKVETHPVTGRFTLNLHEYKGQQSQHSGGLSGVVAYVVERP